MVSRPLVVIPARLAASRLPGKPLADIGGVPMIVRVLRQAQAADVGPVVVAAGDSEIVAAVEAAGGHAVLTDPGLPSGSDRVQAAWRSLDFGSQHDRVINVQGDMPFIDPDVIRVCAEELERCDISTIVAPEATSADRTNASVVKAVLAEDGPNAGRALYFTRSTLYGDGPVWRHVGIYGYRREALARFTAAPQSKLERREGLEQLRALELGLTIRAAVVEGAPMSVDTPEDLAAARRHAETTLA